MNYNVDYLYILSFRLYKMLEKIREQNSHSDTQLLELFELNDINKILDELKRLATL